MDLAVFQVLQRWDAQGELPLRVYAMALGTGPDADVYLAQGPSSGGRLDLRAVKFMMDGSLGSRGAALESPYADAPGTRGYLLLSAQELERRARPFVAKGFQIAVHAIGDRANHEVLGVFARLQRDFPKSTRNRVEHAQVLRAEDVPRFHQLGVIASMQPTHATSDMAFAKSRLGEARLSTAYAWSSLLKSGATLAFGSDFPVEAPDVLVGLYAARTRMNSNGSPEGGWLPQERLSAAAALDAFTQGAAYASFSEQRRGRLAPGMDADFTVLSVDPVAAPPKLLLKGRVVRTVVGGRTVYPVL
jgi:predicted amidohydrolase YtcJ